MRTRAQLKWDDDDDDEQTQKWNDEKFKSSKIEKKNREEIERERKEREKNKREKKRGVLLLVLSNISAIYLLHSYVENRISGWSKLYYYFFFSL